MATPRSSVAAILTPQDIADIIRRRLERGAARALAKQYHTGTDRIYNIWEEAGLRDRRAAKTAPVPREKAPEGSGARTSKTGQFVAREPPPPAKVDAKSERARKGVARRKRTAASGSGAGASSADSTNELRAKAQVALGSIGAGNDSGE